MWLALSSSHEIPLTHMTLPHIQLVTPMLRSTNYMPDMRFGIGSHNIQSNPHDLG